MLKTLSFIGVAAFIAVAAASFAVDYDEEDITAYHFHTYFFIGNQRAEEEAMSFRLVALQSLKVWIWVKVLHFYVFFIEIQTCSSVQDSRWLPVCLLTESRK